MNLGFYGCHFHGDFSVSFITTVRKCQKVTDMEGVKPPAVSLKLVR